MSVSRWRRVEYTDDGCSIYECLSCYKRWEARTNPSYEWKFCPYCASEWTGEEEYDDKVFERKEAQVSTIKRIEVYLQMKLYIRESEGYEVFFFECLEEDNGKDGWEDVDRFVLHNLEYKGEDVCTSRNHYDQIKYCKDLGTKILEHAKKLKSAKYHEDYFLYTDGIELRVSVKYPNQDEYFIPITRQIESLKS